MEADQIIIDGSLYEGGGQIFRTCLALSVILKKGFTIHSIRKNRPNPGINNQLRSILVPFLDKLPGVGTDSLTITTPQPPKISKISSNTGSSCTLMLQCLIPVALWTGDKSMLTVEGGTDVSKSPCIKSIMQGLIPLLARMGITVEINDLKKGYYPKGGGFIKYTVFSEDKYVKPITQTEVVAPTSVNITYYQKKKGPLSQGHNQLKKAIKQVVREVFGEEQMLDIEIQTELAAGCKTDNYGIGCLLKDEQNKTILDCSRVGEPATEEDIIKMVKQQVRGKTCVDEFHQDQLLIFMALAQGVSKLRIGKHQTLHTQSLLYVLKQFIPNLKVKHEDGVLEIEGIGMALPQ